MSMEIANDGDLRERGFSLHERGALGEAESLFNRSHARLLGGDFANGWRDFESRWHNRWGRALREARSFREPLWLGETPLLGKTILLHAEQGLGDTLQFCRYAKQVSALGGRVILEVQASLASLLASLPGVDQLVVQGKALPPFECHCPLLSLPLAMNTTLDSIPAQIPYVRSTVDRLRYWHEKLGIRSRPRIGTAPGTRARGFTGSIGPETGTACSTRSRAISIDSSRSRPPASPDNRLRHSGGHQPVIQAGYPCALCKRPPS